MRMSWKGWAAVACLAVAASPAFAQKADSLEVDGNDWTSAAAAERRAFLVGAANVVIAENADANVNAASRPEMLRDSAGWLTGVPSCCALRYSPSGRPVGLMPRPAIRR